MNYWIIAPILFVALFILLEIRNRKMRPVYAQLEREYAEVLEGRFAASPVQRRRFMRALAHFACSENGERLALSMFQGIQKRAADIRDQAACLLMTGMCLEEMGEFDNAMRAYDSVCGACGDFKLGHLKRAHLLSKLGKPESIDAYKKVLDMYPNDAVQINNYASALIRQNLCAEAVEQLKKAISIDDKLSTARGMLALAYSRMGDKANSEQAFEDAVAHGENTEELREILNGHS